MKYTAVFALLPLLASFASATVQVTISPEAESVAGKYSQRIDISKQQFHLNRDGSLPADTRFTVKLGLSVPFQCHLEGSASPAEASADKLYILQYYIRSGFMLKEGSKWGKLCDVEMANTWLAPCGYQKQYGADGDRPLMLQGQGVRVVCDRPANCPPAGPNQASDTWPLWIKAKKGIDECAAGAKKSDWVGV